MQKLTEEARCIQLFMNAAEPEKLLSIARQIVAEKKPVERKVRSDKGKTRTAITASDAA